MAEFYDLAGGRRDANSGRMARGGGWDCLSGRENQQLRRALRVRRPDHHTCKRSWRVRGRGLGMTIASEWHVRVLIE